MNIFRGTHKRQWPDFITLCWSTCWWTSYPQFGRNPSALDICPVKSTLSPLFHSPLHLFPLILFRPGFCILFCRSKAELYMLRLSLVPVEQEHGDVLPSVEGKIPQHDATTSMFHSRSRVRASITLCFCHLLTGCWSRWMKNMENRTSSWWTSELFSNYCLLVVLVHAYSFWLTQARQRVG